MVQYCFRFPSGLDATEIGTTTIWYRIFLLSQISRHIIGKFVFKLVVCEDLLTSSYILTEYHTLTMSKSNLGYFCVAYNPYIEIWCTKKKKNFNNNNSENVIRNTYNYRQNGSITLTQNYFLYKLRKLYYKLNHIPPSCSPAELKTLMKSKAKQRRKFSRPMWPVKHKTFAMV